MCEGGKPDTGKFHSSYIGMNVCVREVSLTLVSFTHRYECMWLRLMRMGAWSMAVCYGSGLSIYTSTHIYIHMHAHHPIHICMHVETLYGGTSLIWTIMD